MCSVQETPPCPPQRGGGELGTHLFVPYKIGCDPSHNQKILDKNSRKKTYEL